MMNALIRRATYPKRNGRRPATGPKAGEQRTSRPNAAVAGCETLHQASRQSSSELLVSGAGCGGGFSASGSWMPVALASSFPRGSDHRADRRPRMACSTSDRDGVDEPSLGVGAVLKCKSHRPQRSGVSGLAGVVVLEPSGELIGSVEDLVDASGHGGHLRYLGRAAMACTTIGPSVDTRTPCLRALGAIHGSPTGPS